MLLSENGELNLEDFSTLINSVPATMQIDLKTSNVPENVIRLDLNYGTTDLKN